jgi:uncharacterized membrane protein YdjX (TVP38/TMEM64 family)
MTADTALPAGLARWRRAGRIALVAALAAGAAAAWHWRAALDPAALTEAIGDSEAAPAIFLLIHVGASLCFVPRTLMAIAAGLAFGMWWGTVWAALGSVLGAIAGFLVARYVNSGSIETAEWNWLRGVERGGWRAVAMIRLIPVIPHSLTNYALGLSRLRVLPYGAGSLVGQLPLTVAYADLGAAGERAMQGAGGWLVPTLIGAAALALSLVIPLIARLRERRG